MTIFEAARRDDRASFETARRRGANCTVDELVEQITHHLQAAALTPEGSVAVRRFHTAAAHGYSAALDTQITAGQRRLYDMACDAGLHVRRNGRSCLIPPQETLSTPPSRATERPLTPFLASLHTGERHT